ncbi:MAG: long-chain fatty acid--CoA ligase [Actinomycetota bacterium]
MAGETVCTMFWNKVEEISDRPALSSREGDAWNTLNWHDYGEAVKEAALGLIALGLEPKQTVGILSSNRPEWHIADVAGFTAGGTTVPVYLTNSPSQVAYILGHSDAQFVFLENEEQLLKIEKERDELPALEHAVIFDGAASADGFVLTMDELRAKGRALAEEQPDLYESRWKDVEPDDTITIVYTSGTTGPPKGAMLSHKNVVFTVKSLYERMPEPMNEGRRVSFLPLSHIAERDTSHFLGIYAGLHVYFAESLDTLARDLAEVKPTVLFAVPRVWEKFYAGIQAKLAALPDEQRQMAEMAVGGAKMAVEARQAGQEVPEELQQRLQMADQMLFAPVRAALGLDEALSLVSGAAPINPDIIKFFHGIGLPIAEVYGQTEDCGPTSLNPRERIKIGTVGPPLDGVEVRIADDGEVLVRGDNVFQGYFKNPEATAEMLEGGWMHSGDVGELDEDGYLTITDRKKDLIITAAGKNIAPQELENRLKYHPLISQAVIIGDRRPFLSALVTLDPEALAKWAADQGLGATDPAELRDSPELEAQIAGAVEAVNAEFSRAEQIKKWTVLDRDFLQEEDEITPTLKVRRRAIVEKYADAIEAMYA